MQGPQASGDCRHRGGGVVGTGPPGEWGAPDWLGPWAAASGAPLTGSPGLRALWARRLAPADRPVCLSVPGSPAAPVQLRALQEWRHV